MDVKIEVKNNVTIAIISSDKLVLTDVPSALDIMATVQYEYGCNRIVLSKSAITEDFFKLSTRLAGEIFQKYVNYNVKLAIIGDFSSYTSKPLKDLIYECNQGRDVFFVATADEAIQRLAYA